MESSQEIQDEMVALHLRRLFACSNTITITHSELIDPIDVDRRADLLIAVEDLLNEALSLAHTVRAMAWQDSTIESTGIENK